MSATVTWHKSLRFEVTYTSWASGPGLAAGLVPPSKGILSCQGSQIVNQNNAESENQVPTSKPDLVQQE